MINLYYYFNFIWFKFIYFEIWFIFVLGFYIFVYIFWCYFGKIISDVLYFIFGWDIRILIIGVLLDCLRLFLFDVVIWWLVGFDGGFIFMLCLCCKEVIVENRGWKLVVYGKLFIWCKFVLFLGYMI